jgi:hypothetical protein
VNGGCTGNGSSRAPWQILQGEDFGLVSKDRLYRCLDQLLEHKTALFSFLRQRWQALFQANFDVLLYDLTSTYPRVKARGQASNATRRKPASDALVTAATNGLMACKACPGEGRGGDHAGRLSAGL